MRLGDYRVSGAGLIFRERRRLAATLRPCGTQLGPARAGSCNRLVDVMAGSARQILRRLVGYPPPEHSGRPDAADEIVINLYQHLVPAWATRLWCSGIRVASWCPDSVRSLGRLMVLASYGAIFFKEPRLADRMRAALGLPFYYLPHACDSHWGRPANPAGTAPCLVITDNIYPNRARQLDRLIAKGIPLRQQRGGFPCRVGETAIRAASIGRYVGCEEKSRANARPFERADCGAAVITEFRPALPELSAIGKEVSAVHDFDDLLEQAAKLLSKHGLTARLSATAQRNHTCSVRVTTIQAKLS